MDINEKINELIIREQYSLNTEEKEREIVPILLEQIKKQTQNKSLMNFYKKLGPIENIKKLIDIPPIHVSLFKKYELKLVPEKEITRILTSSGTTSQLKSKIYLDKETAFRQAKALSNILKNHIGNKRKPMIIIDTEKVNNSKNESINARGAAIRGITQFGKEVTYVLEGDKELKLNYKKLEEFVKKYSDEEIILFGFTYLIWAVFYEQLKSLDKKFRLNATIIHSGGWKKLQAQQVSKEIFNKETSRILGIKPENVQDMYGLVEQVGVVFIDCKEGNKHTPNFAEVIIRDPLTMKEVKKGEIGLIEILSILPESYPGQALITEDLGLFMGVDNCPCGRKGKYFRFISRVEESETRGCGDSYS